jgi:flagellar hook-associated protein 2
MKEEQITKWEEKAKQGLLYHDSTLSKIISDMRSSISGTVELDDGTKVSIFNLGISTTGIKGQLTLDEDKLKKALSEDPDIVYNVFGTLNTNTGKTGSEYQGVAQRLGDIFTDATKAIKNRAGSSADIAEDSDLNNLLRELQTKMSNFKKLMSSFEDRLYKKYDAMEAALTKLGTQLSFITGGQ